MAPLKREIRAKRGRLPALLLLLATPLPAGAAGTLDRLIGQLDQQIDLGRAEAELRRGDLAVVVRRGAGVSGDLRRVLERLVIGRMVERGVRSCVALPPATGHTRALRQAREQGFEWLIALTASATHGELELAGELRRSDALIWRDLLQPRRGAVSYTHLTLPTTRQRCRSRWAPDH